MPAHAPSHPWVRLVAAPPPPRPCKAGRAENAPAQEATAEATALTGMVFQTVGELSDKGMLYNVDPSVDRGSPLASIGRNGPPRPCTTRMLRSACDACGGASHAPSPGPRLQPPPPLRAATVHAWAGSARGWVPWLLGRRWGGG